MAKAKKRTQKRKFSRFHKFSAGLSLLAFLVVLVAGLRSGVSLETITWRAFIVMVSIAVLTRIVIKTLASFEELDRG